MSSHSAPRPNACLLANAARRRRTEEGEEGMATISARTGGAPVSVSINPSMSLYVPLGADARAYLQSRVERHDATTQNEKDEVPDCWEDAADEAVHPSESPGEESWPLLLVNVSPFEKECDSPDGALHEVARVLWGADAVEEAVAADATQHAFPGQAPPGAEARCEQLFAAGHAWSADSTTVRSAQSAAAAHCGGGNWLPLRFPAVWEIGAFPVQYFSTNVCVVPIGPSLRLLTSHAGASTLELWNQVRRPSTRWRSVNRILERLVESHRTLRWKAQVAEVCVLSQSRESSRVPLFLSFTAAWCPWAVFAGACVAR